RGLSPEQRGFLLPPGVGSTRPDAQRHPPLSPGRACPRLPAPLRPRARRAPRPALPRPGPAPAGGLSARGGRGGRVAAAAAMAFTLYSLLQAALLCVNAIAVLHEERFLRNVGWGTDQGIGGFGEEPGIKAQLMNLIRSVRTVMRGKMKRTV
uniref:Immediate early response 3-interacting protein 1 n=1 Tax=Chrysemys picta bellii TaxID=8478 RepID=A0A8C3IPJ8_CHRPI